VFSRSDWDVSSTLGNSAVTRVISNPKRYAVDFSKIINEILQPPAGVDGIRLDVRVEVTAVNPTGFDEPKRRTVSENAETLRFEQHGFEEL
jgi:hypothetical protein